MDDMLVKVYDTLFFDDSLDYPYDPAPDGVLVFGRRDFEPGVERRLLDERHMLLPGVPEYYLTGYAIDSQAGDIDGDGYAEFLLSLSRVSFEGVDRSGLVYLVYGQAVFPARVDLQNLGASGLRFARLIAGEPFLEAGLCSALAGDLDTDGQLDLAVMTRGRGTEDGFIGAGSAHVIYGGMHLAGNIELGQVGQGVPGFVVRGAHGDAPGGNLDGLGLSMAGARDVNDDGHDDLVAGARGVNGYDGATYLVLGGPGLQGVGELRISEPGGPLVEIQGVEGARGQLGDVVTATGDVDGDSRNDFVAGGDSANAIDLILGTRDWPASVRLTDPGLRWFRLTGRQHPTPIGLPVVLAPIGNVAGSAGDWNGDGFADFVVTSKQEPVRHGVNSGEAYIVFGGTHLDGASTSTSDGGTPALPGLTIQGKEADAWFGADVDGKGDLNGDGWSDLLFISDYRTISFASDLPVTRGFVHVLLGGRGLGANLEVLAVKPQEAEVEGGEEATIFGSGFRGDETVRFGGVPSPRVTAVSSAELRVEVPSGVALGPVDVDVVGGPGHTARLEKALTYIDERFSRDLMLDPLWLAASGYRTLIFTDTPWGPPNQQVGQFMNVYFHDLNRDGLDDLFIGEPTGGDPRNGKVSILFGTTTPPASVGLGEADAHGTVIEAEPGRLNLGTYLAFPGDMDGDGYEDLVLGGITDQGALPPSRSGAAYLVFGDEEWPARMALAQALEDGRVLAIPNHDCGQSRVAGPGDLDGDAHPDLVLSYSDSECQGSDARARVILGGPQLRQGDLGPEILVLGDPTPVVPYVSSSRHHPRWFGSGLCAAGDVNGDDRPDFLVGADHRPGAAYFVLESPAQERSVLITDLVAAKQAVTVTFEQGVNDFGVYTAGLGDFNGDGLGDVALGTPNGGGDNHGASYVVLGSRDFGATTSEVKVLREGPRRVIKMFGEFGNDFTGYVSALGDVNGDGLGDLGITGSGHLSQSSRAYIVFGSPESPAELELGYLGHRGFRLISPDATTRLSGFQGGIASGDFDGDGARDIAVGQAVQGVSKRVLLIFGKKKSTGVFLRGDANGDGRADISDAVLTLGYLFLGGQNVTCKDAADADDSGDVELTDAIYLLGHLFLGGPPPPAPFPGPGKDPTEDELGCVGF